MQSWCNEFHLNCVFVLQVKMSGMIFCVVSEVNKLSLKDNKIQCFTLFIYGGPWHLSSDKKRPQCVLGTLVSSENSLFFQFWGKKKYFWDNNRFLLRLYSIIDASNSKTTFFHNFHNKKMLHDFPKTNLGSTPKVTGVYSVPRSVLHPSLVEICSVAFVLLWWQTNKQTPVTLNSAPLNVQYVRILSWNMKN